jgi:alpha-beta hydrolase superfamily lysophospholipase
VSLTATDGVRLAGTFYPAGAGDSEAVVLLLHAAFEDRSSWREFAAALQRAGVSALALDFRGHGESDGDRTFAPVMDTDVDAALTWLGSMPKTGGSKVGIAGASLGANLALRAAARRRAVTAVALLSPGTQLWDVGIAGVVEQYGVRPLLVVACDQDRYAADTVTLLARAARGACQCSLLPGQSHGVRMFESHPALRDTLIEWFRKTLRRDP